MNTPLKTLGLIIVSLLSYVSFGQILSESLTSGSLPAGWSQNSITFQTSAGGYAHFTSSSSTLTSSSFDASPYCGVTVTFDVAKYGSGGDGPITVEYSIDGGANWVTAGDSPTPTSSSYVGASIAINVVSANMVIRLNRGSSSSQKRVRNFVITKIDCSACPGLDTEPSDEPTGLSASASDCTTGDVSWTLGADASDILVVISTSAITGSPTDGVEYNANAVFGSGDILNAGEFVVYNGSGGSITVSGLSDNTTYFIKVFSYNGTIADCEENYLTGGITTSFTTMTGCASASPQITSILYDSCNGGSEGTDEIWTFTSGSDPIDIDDITIDYPGGAPDYCNSGCGSNTNINNPTYINDLNTLAGCTIFAYANPIPANSDVMVFTGSPPSTVLDYSSQCGASNLPIYVFFNNNASISGRFANCDGSPRTLTVDFGSGSTDVVSYTGSDGACGDGATVQFDADGNPTYFNSSNCVYPLPISLLHFNGVLDNGNVNLSWGTASERNNDYFVIEKSLDGINFNAIGEVKGAGNSATQQLYAFEDMNYKVLAYYRLKQVDFDGSVTYSDLRSIKIDGSGSLVKIYPNPTVSQLVIESNNLSIDRIKIYNTLGQNMSANYHYTEIGTDKLKLNVSSLPAGVYYVVVNSEVIRFTKS